MSRPTNQCSARSRRGSSVATLRCPVRRDHDRPRQSAGCRIEGVGQGRPEHRAAGRRAISNGREVPLSLLRAQLHAADHGERSPARPPGLRTQNSKGPRRRRKRPLLGRKVNTQSRQIRLLGEALACLPRASARWAPAADRPVDHRGSGGCGSVTAGDVRGGQTTDRARAGRRERRP
jgi:hypothetical protein